MLSCPNNQEFEISGDEMVGLLALASIEAYLHMCTETKLSVDSK
uniref:Uncharacterized protein n=1 Tax=Arundo donax TaxID=35708 RepID=A0A0A8Y8H7_ARUDO